MLDKKEMVDRNKLHRVRAEDTILTTVDHPFVATLYSSFQTDTAVYFVMEVCSQTSHLSSAEDDILLAFSAHTRACVKLPSH